MNRNGTHADDHAAPIDMLEIVPDDDQYLTWEGIMHVMHELILLFRGEEPLEETQIDPVTASEKLTSLLQGSLPHSPDARSALWARFARTHESRVASINAQGRFNFADHNAHAIGEGITQGMEVAQALFALKQPVTPEFLVYFWLMVITQSHLCPDDLQAELMTVLIKHMLPELPREKWHLAALLFPQLKG